MKLYDVEVSAQTGLADAGSSDDDKPLFDKSDFGKRLHSGGSAPFNGFKF
jgi:hypothetical protein